MKTESESFQRTTSTVETRTITWDDTMREMVRDDFESLYYIPENCEIDNIYYDPHNFLQVYRFVVMILVDYVM